MSILNRLERRLSRWRIQPFYKYLVIAMAGVYLLDMFTRGTSIAARLALFMPRVFSGEVWRLVTFLVVPPGGSIFQTALTLYFYYFVGTALEARWGARRFLLFYAIGALAAITAALITYVLGIGAGGFGTNLYLNLSLFFAFAITYPDFQILLFFILPIKMKWLALLNALYYIYNFVFGAWDVRIAILLSLVNLVLFFGGDMLNLARTSANQWKRRQAFRRSWK